MSSGLPKSAPQGHESILPLSSIIAVSLWCGLLTGITELCARELNRLLFRAPLVYDLNTIWMTPVADAALFSAIGVLLFFASRIVRRLATTRAMIVVFAFCFWTSLTISLHRLHWAAAIILAAGLAAQTMRLTINRVQRSARLVQFGLPLLITAVALSAGLILGLPALSERREIRQLAPAGNRPNILLLILDTVRSSSLGLYGGEATTPNIDSLGMAGIVFDRAIAPASYTLGSHVTFLTGRWAHELGVDWETGLDSRYPTLAEVLRSAGYRTAGFSANQHYVTSRFGIARGFIHFNGTNYSPSEILRNSTIARHVGESSAFRHVFGFDDLLGRKHAATNNAEIIRWASRNREHPFFIFGNYYEAHAPYLPSAPWDSLQPWHRTRGSQARKLHAYSWREPERIPLDAARARRPAYQGAIAELDTELGELFSALRQQGSLDNTLIILASDHGEEFGEHAMAGHGNTLYLQSIHVPLIVSGVGQPQGRHVHTTVSLRDLPNTILALARLAPSLPGHSLTGLWGPDSSTVVISTAYAEIPHARNLPPHFPLSRGAMVSVVTDTLQYIRDGRGGEQVFDLTVDPTGSALAVDADQAKTFLRSLIPASKANADW